jgi:hypothetical protein
VADELESISKAGVRGIALSFVNYLDELPYFCAEVLPRLVRLGARSQVSASRFWWPFPQPGSRDGGSPPPPSENHINRR